MKPFPKGLGVGGLALVVVSSINGDKVRELGNEIGTAFGLPWLGAALQLALIIAGAVIAVLSHSLTGSGGKPVAAPAPTLDALREADGQ